MSSKPTKTKYGRCRDSKLPRNKAGHCSMSDGPKFAGPCYCLSGSKRKEGKR
jgi:hypothetical protein